MWHRLSVTIGHMFPLSHVYISTEASGKRNDAIVIGSAIPDMAWISPFLKNRLHNEPGEFWKFIKDNHPQLIDVALGLKLHSPISGGADYYSDDDKVGYAKVMGKNISADVADIFAIENDYSALNFAHNFIEAAIDLNIQKPFPWIAQIYHAAISNVEKLGIAGMLANYLHIDTALVADELQKYFTRFSADNLSSAESIAKNIITPLIASLGFGVPADELRVIALLKESQTLISGSFLTFMSEVVSKIKVNFDL